MVSSSGKPKKVSVFQAGVNSLKSSIGVGVYAMPAMFMAAGPQFGAALLILTVMVSCHCVGKLVHIRHVLQARDAGENGDNEVLRDVNSMGATRTTRRERINNTSSRATTTTTLIVESPNNTSSDDDVTKIGSSHSMSPQQQSSESSEDSMAHHDRNSYPNLAFRAMGTGGRIVAIAGLWLSMYGSLISYVIFIKQNLASLVPVFQPLKMYIPSMLFPVLVFFLLFKNMKLLFYVNAVSMLFLAAGTVMIGTVAAPHMDKTTTLLLLNWADPQSPSNLGRPPNVDAQTLAVAFGICAFAMEGLIALAMENYDSLERPRQMFAKVTWTSMLTFCVLYITFSTLAVYAFFSDQNGIQGSILEVDHVCMCCV